MPEDFRLDKVHGLCKLTLYSVDTHFDKSTTDSF